MYEFITQDQVTKMLFGIETPPQAREHERGEAEDTWDVFPNIASSAQSTTIIPSQQNEFHISGISKCLAIPQTIKRHDGKFYYVWNPNHEISEVLMISPNGECKVCLQTNMYELQNIYFFSAGIILTAATIMNMPERNSFILFCNDDFTLNNVVSLGRETIYNCQIAQQNDSLYCITACSEKGVQYKKIYCFGLSGELLWCNTLPKGISGYNLELAECGMGKYACYGNRCDKISRSGQIVESNRYDIAIRLFSRFGGKTFVIASPVKKEKRHKKSREYGGIELITSSKEALYEIMNDKATKLQDVAYVIQFWSIKDAVILISNNKSWAMEFFNTSGQKMWSLNVEERLACKPCFFNDIIVFSTNLLFDADGSYFVLYRVTYDGTILNRTIIRDELAICDIQCLDGKLYYFQSGIRQCEADNDAIRLSEWHFSTQLLDM